MKMEIASTIFPAFRFHYYNACSRFFLKKMQHNVHLLQWLSVAILLCSSPICEGALLQEQTEGLAVGINYGQIANNLPSPSLVAVLLRSLNVRKVKLYDADPNVLRAFAGTNVEFVVGIGNEYVAKMTNPSLALNWVQLNVQPYLPNTHISCITVGNEVFSGNDTTLMVNLLPAMLNIHNALSTLDLADQVTVTTAHSLTILSSSYPPSAGAFRQDLAQYMQPLVNFHAQTGSPFLINAYPYFAYKGNPNQISLDFVLFQPNQGVLDPVSNQRYDNMLYAQIDAVYAALEKMGQPDLPVRVSETGWPSKGDLDEAGATLDNAGIYNGNLLKRIEMKQGTPMRPSVPLDTYVFALFNEDLKPGPTSERNYGLFHPDGTPVYNIGLSGVLPGYYESRAWGRSSQISWTVGFLTIMVIMITWAQ